MNIIKYFVLSMALLISYNAGAGLQLGATRVVISDGKNEGTVNIHNRENKNYLIQSWILDKNEKISEDIALTPPIFKLNGNTSNSLRMILTKDLPQDKETLYWLNVKFIPSENNDKKNKLIFAINNQIKIIYRPSSISNHNMLDEFKKIKIVINGNKVEFNNPTKHYVSISNIVINGKEVEAPSYIEPGSSIKVTSEGRSLPSMLEYTFIDDYGRLNTFNYKM